MQGRYSSDDIRQALLQTIHLINKWSREDGAIGVSLMNFAVSDGSTTVCSRYVNSTTMEPASLFYASGRNVYMNFRNVIYESMDERIAL